MAIPSRHAASALARMRFVPDPALSRHGAAVILLGACAILAAIPARAQCPTCPPLTTCGSGPTCAGSSALCGAWSPIIDWRPILDNGCGAGAPYVEVSHAALIPVGGHTGKVLLWRESLTPPSPPPGCEPRGTEEVWLFNPANPGPSRRCKPA